jgi:hypothetical protein
VAGTFRYDNQANTKAVGAGATCGLGGSSSRRGIAGQFASLIVPQVAVDCTLKASFRTFGRERWLVESGTTQANSAQILGINGSQGYD